MNATVTYRIQYLPHPWDEKRRKEGVECYCLVKVVRPSMGPRTYEPVAIFNFDSEAVTFAGEVIEADKERRPLVEVPEDLTRLLKMVKGEVP